MIAIQEASLYLVALASALWGFVIGIVVGRKS
jgi:hypothetical protein